MKSITKQKPLDEIEQALAPFDRVFIVGCGTCATMTRTGGVEEVAEMSNTLQEWGKIVTGLIVIPIACDEMSGVTMGENRQALQGANAVLVMSCALGVQKVGSYIDIPVIPALDTLFVGLEESPGSFHEVCAQCGQCVLGETAGICPLTACHKGLLNGPCGGTNNGKCEVDPEKDCAWTLIYQRLEKQGRLDIIRKYQPPKGTNLEGMLHHIDILKDKVDAINVTDHQSSVMRFPSLGACLAIKEWGGEPILQMTCRDRNRLALEADLLFAHTRGINNVLCLTGDAVPVGDHKQAKGVFDLDSVQLLHTIRLLESGSDLGGNELDGAVDFCAGAIVTPEANPLEPQLAKFEKKVEAGAEFIQTQAIYDLENFARFMEFARKFPVKILAGIVLLSSAKMAEFMNADVPGILVPQNLIDELAAAPKGTRVDKGIEIAGRMIAALKKESICDGVHIMAIGREERVPDILEVVGLGSSGPSGE